MRNFLFCLSLIASFNVFADAVAYSGEKFIYNETAELLLLHGHYRDYDFKNGKITWHSKLELMKTIKSRKVLFKVESDFFDYVRVTEDLKYIIGLSKVKLYGNNQLSIYNLQGTLIGQQKVDCETLNKNWKWASYNNCTESITNYVDWYRKINNKTPITVKESDNKFEFCFVPINSELCLSVMKT